MITYATATGKDIYRLIEKMQGALVGEDPNSVVIASLTLAVGLQIPGIPLTTLIQTVQSASEFISLTADSIDNPVTPERVN